MQVLEEGQFGFQLLYDTIASYEVLAPDELPSNDDEKIQLWIKQQSKTRNLNFVPYYAKWGWPIAKETSEALKDLPDYNSEFP